jgi:hypothetical protein
MVQTGFSQPRARLAFACVWALLGLFAFAYASPTPSALAAGSSPTSPSGGAAASEGNAFSELSSGAAQTESTQTKTTETKGSTEQTSNSKKTVVIALGSAIILLIAIASVIVRDARKVAPAGDGPLAEARAARDTAATLRRRRTKAKAARQQRKRNR